MLMRRGEFAFDPKKFLVIPSEVILHILSYKIVPIINNFEVFGRFKLGFTNDIYVVFPHVHITQFHPHFYVLYKKSIINGTVFYGDTLECGGVSLTDQIPIRAIENLNRFRKIRLTEGLYKAIPSMTFTNLEELTIVEFVPSGINGYFCNLKKLTLIFRENTYLPNYHINGTIENPQNVILSTNSDLFRKVFKRYIKWNISHTRASPFYPLSS